MSPTYRQKDFPPQGEGLQVADYRQEADRIKARRTRRRRRDRALAATKIMIVVAGVFTAIGVLAFVISLVGR